MKRCCDLVFAGVAVLALLPILLPVMLILRMTGNRQVLYREPCVGRNGQQFDLLRLARIDRGIVAGVPRLLNVLAGHICLVGPDPLSIECFAQIPKPMQLRRTAVVPGCLNISTLVCRGGKLSLAKNDVGYKCRMMCGYLDALDEWHLENNNFTTYLLVLFSALLVFLLPVNQIIWWLFPDLPQPPSLLQRVV